jgi:hypothetical protein
MYRRQHRIERELPDFVIDFQEELRKRNRTARSPLPPVAGLEAARRSSSQTVATAPTYDERPCPNCRNRTLSSSARGLAEMLPVATFSATCRTVTRGMGIVAVLSGVAKVPSALQQSVARGLPQRRRENSECIPPTSPSMHRHDAIR